FDRFFNGRARLCLVGNVQLDKRKVLARNVAVGIAHFVEIPSSRHDAVSGSQSGLGDAGANATTGTGDKPNLAHDSRPSIPARKSFSGFLSLALLTHCCNAPAPYRRLAA